ncbi:MAG: hypothetical protein IT381_10075 [Deltaproteobacteria bacterium]|nr:hypothetical protein [Deltaproteobacteria bacterium]
MCLRRLTFCAMVALMFSACAVAAPARLQSATPGASPANDLGEEGSVVEEAEPAPAPAPTPDLDPPAPPPTCATVQASCPTTILDSFEEDPIAYAAAPWADATLAANGSPATLSRAMTSASDGAFSLRVPLRTKASGYSQGYVGRPIERSLAGCARLSFEIGVPANAPAGLRAKGILHLAGAWTEPETSIALQPGTTTTVHVPLAAAFAALPARAAYATLTAIGVKIEASNAAYDGPVYIDQLRVAPDWPREAEDLSVRSAGVFGGFERSSGDDIPNRNGFLTFVADQQAAKHALLWPKLGPNDGDFQLVETRFGNAPGGGLLSFVDWTTLQADTAVSDGGTHAVRAIMSRVFPAVRYTTSAKHLTLATKKDGRARMRGLAMVQNGVVTTIDLNATAVSVATMSEPWIVLFAAGAAGWPFDAPLLVTFQNRPSALTATAEGLDVTFAAGAGAVHVMPLHGLRRFSANTAWLAGIPAESVALARALVPKLAAFPVKLEESATSDATEVHITAKLTHLAITDQWGTVPAPVAVLPPLVAQAKTKGYPVRVDGTLATLDVPTFYGPLTFVAGPNITYHLPLPNGVSRVELPLRVINDTHAATVHGELLRVIREQVQTEPGTFYLDGDDRTAAFLCEAAAALEPGTPEREKAVTMAAKLIEHGWLDSSLQTLREPVTHQRYMNAAKYWASNEPFDKEWYTGRQLAALAGCAEIVDLDLARGVWPKALSLYRYDRVFFDWATGSALSSVFGYTALIDGIYFAWEGMLAVARLAKRLGDTAIYDDAVYHAARQQLAVFTLWHHAEWARDLDYGVGHLSQTKLAQSAVDTRGAIDGFVEDTGCTTLEFQSFWQTANAVAFDVLPQFALYRDFGIAPRLRTLLFDIMPALHPDWQDGNVFLAVDDRYYGGNNTAFHLTARAAMFHADPAPLFATYNASAGTEASKQWYSMRWHGLSGPMLLAFERAKAPTVEVPVAEVRPSTIVFDAKTQVLSFDGDAVSSGRATFRISGATGPSRDVKVDVCEGERVKRGL